MKTLKLLIALAILTGCNGDGYDLSHHYEPHVTIRHSEDNAEKHYYSVMLVVKKDCMVYAKKTENDGKTTMKYYFTEATGKLQIASKTYNLEAGYELRLYEYPVSLDSKKDVENVVFIAEVADPPVEHSHEHPKFLHNGTIHTPGDGS
ncbi:hypothetical protein SAMN05421640_2778 [Ekhidna lutea]|uniref:Lipoprotein n=1 Tax=Ekhidna lutea TaxID=447679 RepID=A0A239KQC2_EKHLU|nr:hypothetical protein [Ekhidna lutea]SNT19384.1 hypothetical protein SAMN05421640_2778 [Ekhidna lutea]